MKRISRSRFSLVNLLMCLGFGFLYAPIVILILYSFNKSKLVTVWAGFSTEWYGKLLDDNALLSAVGISLKVASSSATMAVFLGTMAGVVLSKLGMFRGRAIFSGMLSAPFIMPEVITGFSLLLLFVTMENIIGWPQGRGVITIILAHTTLGMAYVAVLVQARLTAFDKSLEEAAADLGARPLKVFMVITLPLILPALIAGWLLSFTLSLDDLVITSFTSGPGATTLPMLIYSKVRLGVTPEINALATLIVLLVGCFATLTYVLVLRGKKA